MKRRTTSILLVDDNSSYVLPVLRCFADCPEISLDVLTYTPEKPGIFRKSRYLRHLYWEKQPIEKGFPGTISRYIRETETDLVIPTSEEVTRLFTENREVIGGLTSMQAVPDPEILETVTDKWSLHNWLIENDFPSTGSVRATDLNGDGASISGLDYPVLLKPVRGYGGNGILYIDSEELLFKELRELDGSGTDYIVQQYVEGHDIDISFFALKGKILFHTIQKAIVDSGFSFARGIRFTHDETLLALVREMVSKLKYSGIAHLDFRFDESDGQYKLVDFNPRYWTTLLGSRTSGINFPLLILKHYFPENKVVSNYHQGTYFSTMSAVKLAMEHVLRFRRPPLKFRETQLYYTLKDPQPELLRIFGGK